MPVKLPPSTRCFRLVQGQPPGQNYLLTLLPLKDPADGDCAGEELICLLDEQFTRREEISHQRTRKSKEHSDMISLTLIFSH